MKKAYFVFVRKTFLLRVAVVSVSVCILLAALTLLHQVASHGVETMLCEGDAMDSPEGYLAIIIDDLGSGREGVKEMMEISQHLTFAVMPFLDYSTQDALSAHEKGYEIIVHLPMEPMKGKRSWLGPNPIMAGMEYEEVRDIVKKSLDDIPYAAGANIHMGSKASSEEIIISAILDEIKERELFFVDSKTASKPIAQAIAKQKNVVCFNRDVFLESLDNKSKSFIKKRLKEAGDIALKKGYAVAIGHVGKEGGKVTAKAITEMIPEFDEKNIKLVFVSELAGLYGEQND